MNELTVIETGEVVEEMSRVEAERVTARIADKLDAIADNLEQVLPLIGEALTRNAWKALGYSGPSAYVTERFATAFQRLPIEVRRPVVAELSAAGMSTRAIAPVIGRSHEIVSRDLKTGVNNVDTSTESKSDAELLAGADWSPAEQVRELAEQHLPKSEHITGMDGKTYTRPEPKEPQKRRRNPLPEQFFKATYDLQKNIERMERLIEDDRFQQNKEQIALRHKNDLLRSAELLQELLHELD